MTKFELRSTNITKELLLNKNPQERYFEHYLGIPIKKGLFVCPSALRIDHRPTCSFYKNNRGDLILNDFAGESYTFIDVVMKIFNCSYYKALKIIANDFNIISSSNYEVNKPKIEYTETLFKEEKNSSHIQVDIKDYSEDELKWWKSFGINLKTLIKFKVFSIKNVYLNGEYFSSSSINNPMYGYYGGLNSKNEELWRIYMPFKTSYRFLSNWKTTYIQGSKQLIYGNDNLVVTKSLKDVMALSEFGINAIAPCSENSFLSKSQYNKLKGKFKNIYLLYDTDLPGIKYTKKIRKEFPDVKILLIPRKYECKDFTDLIKKYGVINVQKLLKEWQTKL